MILSDIPGYDDFVDAHTLVWNMNYQFKQDLDLPGILIKHPAGELVGMVSRDCFFETLGRPFGVELYSKLTAQKFFDQVGYPPLILDEDIRIEEAIKRALSRTDREVYEPVIVHYRNDRYSIISMHTLLSAQCDLLERLYQEVQQLSIRDPLTNLFNRRGFFHESRPQIEFALKKEYDLSALMIDIDHFKRVNDIYGHFVGDSVLKTVAEECQKGLRQTDLIGRFGGEEFVAILPVTSMEIALVIAERIRSKVEKLLIYLNGFQISVTISIGVSHFKDAKGSMDLLLTQADQAMYAAKKAGRNKVVAYRPGLLQAKKIDLTGDQLSLTSGPELSQNYTQATSIFEETIQGWARALELRDKETEGHAQRVTQLTVELAKKAGINDQQLVHIRWGALLHDIGKIAIPDDILFKPGQLSDNEWVVMKKHPVYAFDLISPIAFLQEAVDIPYCHHEHWDGGGYPRGLKGEEIPMAARIFTVIDVWDALSTDRCYRPAWPPEEVYRYLREQSGKMFDPYVVNLFLEMMEFEKPLAYSSFNWPSICLV